MGCLIAGVAALLALAVPASIARASLVGAYVVIALLAAVAVAAIVWRSRRPRTPPQEVTPRLAPGLVRIGVLAVAYAIAVTLIHTSG